MEFSMNGQEKGDLLIQVTARTGLTLFCKASTSIHEWDSETSNMILK